MTKEEAKQKYKAGEIQICYDVEKLELLRYVTGMNHYNGILKNYRCPTLNSNNEVLTINISEIEEEVVWLGSDMQYFESGEWHDCYKNFKFRLKPKPDYTSEIEALQAKAKENGMKAVITFEKL